jgi:hypothetical protein
MSEVNGEGPQLTDERRAQVNRAFDDGRIKPLGEVHRKPRRQETKPAIDTTTATDIDLSDQERVTENRLGWIEPTLSKAGEVALKSYVTLTSAFAGVEGFGPLIDHASVPGYRNEKLLEALIKTGVGVIGGIVGYSVADKLEGGNNEH